MALHSLNVLLNQYNTSSSETGGSTLTSECHKFISKCQRVDLDQQVIDWSNEELKYVECLPGTGCMGQIHLVLNGGAGQTKHNFSHRVKKAVSSTISD